MDLQDRFAQRHAKHLVFPAIHGHIRTVEPKARSSRCRYCTKASVLILFRFAGFAPGHPLPVPKEREHFVSDDRTQTQLAYGTPGDGHTGWSLRRRVGSILLVAAALVPLAALFVTRILENLHVVLPGELYRSAQPTDATLRRIQRDFGIRSVVNLRGPWPGKPWYDAERAVCAALGVTMYDVALCSHRLAPMDELRRLVRILDSCEKPVLLHCRRGADRTSLACAVYMVLYEGAGLDEALEQYRIIYGHTGYAWGSHLPHLFDCYRDWLREKGVRHSPVEFRDWIATERFAGHFGGELTLTDPLGDLPADQATPLVYRAVNVSRYPWRSTEPFHEGIHLRVTVRREPAGQECVVLYAGGTLGTVPPNGRVDFRLVLPPLERPGRYSIDAELIDAHEVRFVIMGMGRCRREVNVVQAAAGAGAAAPTAGPIRAFERTALRSAVRRE
jgi:protein tyrosine phosphatase (PTP) superfamily phosphohydrolase (DUF442 family)